MSKNMVGTNNIGTKTIGTKIFWSKHILSSKDMLEPKRSGVKKEILGQKKNWVGLNTGAKRMFGPTKMFVNNNKVFLFTWKKKRSFLAWSLL